MGRRPKPDDEKRERSVLLKLTDDDLATIDAKAAAANATRNEYIVARAVDREPEQRKSEKGAHVGKKAAAVARKAAREAEAAKPRPARRKP